MNNDNYRVSAQAIILNEDDRVLMLKEKKGIWDFPGGGLEYGESPEECLKRELKEELGINEISIESDLPIFILSNPISKDLYQLTLFYKVSIPSTEIKTERSIEKHEFVSTSKLKELNINAKRKGIINSIKKYL